MINIWENYTYVKIYLKTGKRYSCHIAVQQHVNQSGKQTNNDKGGTKYL